MSLEKVMAGFAVSLTFICIFLWKKTAYFELPNVGSTGNTEARPVFLKRDVNILLDEHFDSKSLHNKSFSSGPRFKNGVILFTNSTSIYVDEPTTHVQVSLAVYDESVKGYVPFL